MKKTILIAFALLFALSACNSNKKTETPPEFKDDNRLKVVVSIPPVQWLTEQIGGNKVQVQSMTVSGDDPHTYEPSPAQMTAVSEANLYLSVGVEFEEAWIPRFQANNANLMLSNLAHGFERIETPKSLLEDEDHDHEHGGLDPHIWLSPAGMKHLAIKTAEALKRHDNENFTYYDENLQKTLTEIGQVNDQLVERFSQPQRQQFLIVHPSLGYLASDYNLIMIPVEVDGQDPSAAQVAAILSASQEYGINTLFVQQGSNIANAETLASHAGIAKIVEFDPLAYDWEANLLEISQALQAALN